MELGGAVDKCDWKEHTPWAIGPKANLIKRMLRFKRPVPAKRGHVGVWAIERNRPPSSEPFQERDDLMAAVYEVWPLLRIASRDGSPLPAVPRSAEGQSAEGQSAEGQSANPARRQPTRSVNFEAAEAALFEKRASPLERRQRPLTSRPRGRCILA